jgi:hypothetical protein
MEFRENTKVKTTVYMSVEDVGIDIPIGTDGIVQHEPSDDEELLCVVIDGSLNYLPQDVFEVV